jgi:hypothetical protein
MVEEGPRRMWDVVHLSHVMGFSSQEDISDDDDDEVMKISDSMSGNAWIAGGGRRGDDDDRGSASPPSANNGRQTHSTPTLTSTPASCDDCIVRKARRERWERRGTWRQWIIWIRLPRTKYDFVVISHDEILAAIGIIVKR